MPEAVPERTRQGRARLRRPRQRPRGYTLWRAWHTGSLPPAQSLSGKLLLYVLQDKSVPVLPNRMRQVCKGYTCVLRGRRLRTQLQHTGRSRPRQAGCSARARPVELHCANRSRSCHGNLHRSAPNLVGRCAKIQQTTPASCFGLAVCWAATELARLDPGEALGWVRFLFCALGQALKLSKRASAASQDILTGISKRDVLLLQEHRWIQECFARKSRLPWSQGDCPLCTIGLMCKVACCFGHPSYRAGDKSSMCV